ncbi:MAG: hypothetical protein L0G27_11545 [Paracoccus sp. (in: a-proteobacteria)]|nr:hypothetical protein [Paracoccus sp. (in: a-proteobacteria)]
MTFSRTPFGVLFRTSKGTQSSLRKSQSLRLKSDPKTRKKRLTVDGFGSDTGMAAAPFINLPAIPESQRRSVFVVPREWNVLWENQPVADASDRQAEPGYGWQTLRKAD